MYFFLKSLLLVLMFSYANGGQNNLTDIVPLVFNNSVENGSSEKNYRAEPNYEVLAINLLDEGSIEVSLENIEDAFFFLFEDTHPNQPNYTINLRNFTIEKDKNGDFNCEKRTILLGSIQLIDNDIMILSWQKKIDTLQLLLQYKNELLFCEDRRNIINFKKLVVKILTECNFSTKKISFSKLENSDVLISRNFNISGNNIFQFYVVMCSSCQINSSLYCNENIFSSNNFTKSSGNILKEVELRGPSTDFNDCHLQIFTLFEGPEDTEKFWFFITRGVLREIKTILPTEATPTTNNPTPNGTSAINFNITIILFLFFQFYLLYLI